MKPVWQLRLSSSPVDKFSTDLAILFITCMSLAALAETAAHPGAIHFPQNVHDVQTQDTHPLVIVTAADLGAALPCDSHLLLDAQAIETFLATVEETAPDWPELYGDGEHDAQMDERLLRFNRSRDEQRRQKTFRDGKITFLWDGELSAYDAERGGFPVAMGPRFTDTRWGHVRFKPADVPSRPLVTPAPSVQEPLAARINAGKPPAVTVAMTGRLIAEESIIYDFSHQVEGMGLIMPVVEVEQVQYLLIEEP
jgi:hypothetical protein